MKHWGAEVSSDAEDEFFDGPKIQTKPKSKRCITSTVKCAHNPASLLTIHKVERPEEAINLWQAFAGENDQEAVTENQFHPLAKTRLKQLQSNALKSGDAGRKGKVHTTIAVTEKARRIHGAPAQKDPRVRLQRTRMARRNKPSATSSANGAYSDFKK